MDKAFQEYAVDTLYRLQTLGEKIIKKLADIGLEIVKIEFAKGFQNYEGNNQYSCYVEELGDAQHLAVTAQGEAVCFIEFGAGVHYNGGGETYPYKKPQGIVGIGEYGKGLGKNDFWYYKKNKSYGNPAQCGFQKATSKVKENIQKVVNEVLNGEI